MSEDHGQMPDAQIFNESELKKCLVDGTISHPPTAPQSNSDIVMSYFFLPVAAFGMRTNLMKPYSRRMMNKEDPQLQDIQRALHCGVRIRHLDRDAAWTWLYTIHRWGLCLYRWDCAIMLFRMLPWAWKCRLSTDPRVWRAVANMHEWTTWEGPTLTTLHQRNRENTSSCTYLCVVVRLGCSCFFLGISSQHVSLQKLLYRLPVQSDIMCISSQWFSHFMKWLKKIWSFQETTEVNRYYVQYLEFLDIMRIDWFHSLNVTYIYICI